MSRKSNIWKTGKWFGLIGTFFLGIIWIGSSLIRVEYNFDDGASHWHQIWRGAVRFGSTRDGWTTRDGWQVNFIGDPKFIWWFRRVDGWRPFDKSSLGCIEIPIWPLVIAAGIPTLALFALDRRAWRRVAIGFCPKCGYDISATTFGTPCPECGTKPRPE